MWRCCPGRPLLRGFVVWNVSTYAVTTVIGASHSWHLFSSQRAWFIRCLFTFQDGVWCSWANHVHWPNMEPHDAKWGLLLNTEDKHSHMSKCLRYLHSLLKKKVCKSCHTTIIAVANQLLERQLSEQKESQIVFQHAFSYPIVQLAEIAETQEDRCLGNLMEFAGCLRIIYHKTI